VWYLTTHFQLWQRSIITKQVRLVLIKRELMYPAQVIRVWLSRTWGIERERDPHLLFPLKFLVLLQAMTLEQTQWELIKCFKPQRLASDTRQHSPQTKSWCSKDFVHISQSGLSWAKVQLTSDCETVFAVLLMARQH